MKKYIKYFTFLFITLVYLYFEVAFRLDMLEVSSTIKDYIEIEKIELVGRLLSSFGIAFFVISNISLKTITNKLSKTIIYSLIAVVTFNLSYQGQKFLIDNIGKNFSAEEKVKMSLLQMDKELIYFDKYNHNDFPFENKNSAESKVALSFYPFVRYTDDLHNSLLLKDHEAIVQNSVYNRWSNNSENFNTLVLKEKKELRKLFNTYFYTKTITSRDYKYKKEELLSIYERLMITTKSNFNALHINKEDYQKEKDIEKYINFRLKLGYSTEDKLFELINNKDTNMVENFGSIILKNLLLDEANGLVYKDIVNFEYPSLLDINYSNKKDIYKIFDLYNFNKFDSSFCTANKRDSENYIFSIKYFDNEETSKIIDKSSFDNFYTQVYKKENKNINYISCVFDEKNIKRLTNKFQKRLEDSKYPYINFDFNKLLKEVKNNPKLLNKGVLREISFSSFMESIRDHEKSFQELYNYDKKVYNLFKNNLKYDSPESFLESVKYIHNEISKEKFYEITKKKGFNLEELKNKPLVVKNDQNLNEFFNHPVVLREIKKNLGFFINPKTGKVYNNLSVPDFSSAESKVALKEYAKYKAKTESAIFIDAIENPHYLKEGQKYEKLGNNIAMSFVAIPFVLSISTIMIFLTIVNIVLKTISLVTEDKKMLRKIKLTLIGLLVLIPLFMTNDYSRNEVQNNFMDTRISSTAVNWFVNTQIILETIYFENDLTEFGYFIIQALGYEMSIGEKNKKSELKHVIKNKAKNSDNVYIKTLNDSL